MDALVVTIKQGQLKGCIRNDIDGGRIISFLGIPFAKPPVGDLRFKAPLPAEPWDGIRDATKEGNMCYSRDLFYMTIDGAEDCLNLNVFTKSLPDTSNLLKPVMVWIHGGAFVSGSSRTDMYGPEFLLTQDIVLVSINYRLGALGFLSAEDVSLEATGNAGLKDQALALKWVQENIRNFNGDPDNVTIFGESAGSGSVHYQVLSPIAKGLFHKAILQSGSCLNDWATARPGAKALAKQLLGRDVEDENEALDALRNAPVEVLFDAQEKLEQARPTSERGYFAPVIEKPNETAFITQRPIDIIRSGNYNKVPLMIGYTTREGLLLAVREVLAGNEGKKYAPNLEDVMPLEIGLKRGSDISKEVCQKLAKFYFKGCNPMDDFYLLSTDAVFVAGIIATVKNHLRTSDNPIYLYRMSLEAGLNIVKLIAKLTNPGACHGDDVGYLFKGVMTPPIVPGSIEDISLRRFVKLWTNFAKYANPTPDEEELEVLWQPVKEGNLHFIDIGKELTAGVNPESERMELWREVYQLSPATAGYL